MEANHIALQKLAWIVISNAMVAMDHILQTAPVVN
jgi:hypothetical protein